MRCAWLFALCLTGCWDYSLLEFCSKAQNCPEAGLIGRWSLDDKAGVVAKDSSTHGNDATLSKTYEWISSAVHEGGLHLGDDGMLTVAALSGTGFPHVGTLSFWFNGPLATPSTLYSLFDGYDCMREHLFARATDQMQVQAVCQTTTEGVPYPAAVYPLMMPGEWNHVVLVWQTSDNGTVATPSWTAFVNGVESTSGIMPASWTPTQQRFTFGGFGAVGLDEIELYDVALSPSEVAKLR
ncbi:MAG: LamG-like jellyroll fold domain-containing protein [Polyangia bacterium]